MTQEIQDFIKESLKDFESNLNSVTYTIGGLLALINIGVGYFINYKLEKYKLRNNERLTRLNNNLQTISKKSEIKYKDHFDAQITKIKELYKRYTDLEFYTKVLLKEEFSSSPHDELKTRISNWYKNMIGINIFYNRNRIVFSDRIKTKFGNHLIYFERINKYLNSEHKSLIELERMYGGDYQSMYGDNNQYIHKFEDNEESEIISRIKTFKDKKEFKNLDSTFNSFKKLLEKEYKKIIS
ncbi:MAG: hypothetical protein GXO88_06805 [Chlorobi bacterium]|nr:hypothetical protein [Chlorobiota bacterium]